MDRGAWQATDHNELQRVGHDGNSLAHMHTHVSCNICNIWQPSLGPKEICEDQKDLVIDVEGVSLRVSTQDKFNEGK